VKTNPDDLVAGICTVLLLSFLRLLKIVEVFKYFEECQNFPKFLNNLKIYEKKNGGYENFQDFPRFLKISEHIFFEIDEDFF
jgi:hypothetical protein